MIYERESGRYHCFAYRAYPPWTRLIALFWILWNVYWLFSTGFLSNPGPWLLSYLVILGFGIIVQIYRYRSISNAVQRQQTKWAVYGFSIAILGFLLLSVGDHAFSLHLKLNAFLTLVINPAYYIIMLIIPVSICIVRSHLWGIDTLINRTLVYGLLTAILALFYIGLIITLQFLLRGIINQNNDVAIVISTLIIAAVFQPLHRRIQAIIDRRFYRRKYDTGRTIEAFSSALRQEVDLNQLSEHLLSVVQETMQARACSSLWLRRPKSARELNTRLPQHLENEE